jgi:cobalt/nickel transport system permease protein
MLERANSLFRPETLGFSNPPWAPIPDPRSPIPDLLFRPEALHIPDGFLSPAVAAAGWLLAVAVIAYALRQTRDQLGERQVPLLGVMAAFIFAAQAINFPVAGGTSGHLLGGALAAIVLGPWAAVLVMTAVIGLQALLFQDGGLLALGWNVLNMGVLTAFSGYWLYRLARRLPIGERAGVGAGGFLSGWLAVEMGAAATAVELALSGTSPLALALPAMLAVHALIGVGEGLITVGALLFIGRTRPDLLRGGEAAPGRLPAGAVAAGLALALGVAAFSFTGSPAPDGLERVAADQGFMTAAQEPLVRIFPDYTIPLLGDGPLAGVLAVVFGAALAFGLIYVIARLIYRARHKPAG